MTCMGLLRMDKKYNHLIDVGKISKDIKVLKEKISNFIFEDRSSILVKLSAISDIFSVYLAGYHVESGKCLETLINSTFCSIKSNTLEAVKHVEERLNKDLK